MGDSSNDYIDENWDMILTKTLLMVIFKVFIPSTIFRSSSLFSSTMLYITNGKLYNDSSRKILRIMYKDVLKSTQKKNRK
mgnify:FL=1